MFLIGFEEELLNLLRLPLLKQVGIEGFSLFYREIPENPDRLSLALVLWSSN